MGYPRDAENGQGLVEYALILVLIAIVVIAILTLLGGNINMVFARILLQIEHPGDYSGDPVTVTDVGLGNPLLLGGAHSSTITVSASPTFDPPGSPEVCVRFDVNGGGSKIVCSVTPSVTLPGPASGSVSACVMGVKNHSLRGGTSCSTTSY